MGCPFHNDVYVGVCTAYETPYVPSIRERESYCSRKDFKACPIYGTIFRRAMRSEDGSNGAMEQ
ncbi:MAG: hypothetical protein HY957_09580 [Nitrospirae bacterium]|nr:hypothetical protein [Nitrospirota bacterium]